MRNTTRVIASIALALSLGASMNGCALVSELQSVEATAVEMTPAELATGASDAFSKLTGQIKTDSQERLATMKGGEESTVSLPAAVTPEFRAEFEDSYKLVDSTKIDPKSADDMILAFATVFSIYGDTTISVAPEDMTITGKTAQLSNGDMIWTMGEKKVKGDDAQSGVITLDHGEDGTWLVTEYRGFHER